MNLSGAENVRSDSLSSGDHGTHNSRFLFGHELSAILSTTFAHALSDWTTKIIKFCKFQSSISCTGCLSVPVPWVRAFEFTIAKIEREAFPSLSRPPNFPRFPCPLCLNALLG